jgi:hypothetical protein
MGVTGRFFGGMAAILHLLTGCEAGGRKQNRVHTFFGHGNSTTRLIVDDISGIKIYREAPGLVENGNVGFRTFVRAHGALPYSGATAQSPFVYIRNHS